MANLIASLPTEERARLYRKMADETQRLAENASSLEARLSYERLSLCWARLAEEVLEEAERAEPVLQYAMN